MNKHLTSEQRYAIFAMTQKPYTQKEIALAIGVSKSTISRVEIPIKLPPNGQSKLTP